MNIVILDGHALNPGDMSWEAFNSFGAVTIYDRTPASLAAQRIGNAEILITNKVTITSDIMDACPSLRYIGVLATGYNIIDIAAAQARNITVTNIPSYSSAAVVQATFALLFELTNHIHEHSASVHNGDWCASPDFCYWQQPLTELYGKTFGIVGFGDIGQRAARAAQAFGMNVIATTRSHNKIERYNENAGKNNTVQNVTIDTLMRTADVISLHCPLTPETTGMINSDTLSTVKKGALLINTARGPIVTESDVRVALDNGTLGGYAADVISAEPMKNDNPLKGAPRCVITPHVAWAARETRERLMQIAVNNLYSFINGSPINTVAP